MALRFLETSLTIYKSTRHNIPEDINHYIYFRKAKNSRLNEMSECITKIHAKKMYGGVKIWRHMFLNSALIGGESSAS